MLILCGRVLPCCLVALVPVLVSVLVLVGGCALAAQVGIQVRGMGITCMIPRCASRMHLSIYAMRSVVVSAALDVPSYLLCSVIMMPDVALVAANLCLFVTVAVVLGQVTMIG